MYTHEGVINWIGERGLEEDGVLGEGEAAHVQLRNAGAQADLVELQGEGKEQESKEDHCKTIIKY